MRIENSNPDIHVLVLARTADPMCAVVATALGQWQFTFSSYSSVHEIVDAARNGPNTQSLILIVRPMMLGPQTAFFIEQNFPNLRVVGWVDPDENMSNLILTQMMMSGMIIVSCIDQLRQVIQSYHKIEYENYAAVETAEKVFSQKSTKLQYELSDDEVNALLGVE